jgi:hypothetical protein
VEIEINSPVLLYVVLAVVVAGILVLVGRAVTPATSDGEILVLSPAYVATVRYLTTAQQRLDDLDAVDEDLTGVLDADRGNIYTQGRDAEHAFSRALNAAREIERDQSPLSLATLQTALYNAGSAYVEAARATLQWVSAPSEENRQSADAAREAARERLSASRQLQEGLWPAE